MNHDYERSESMEMYKRYIEKIPLNTCTLSIFAQGLREDVSINSSDAAVIAKLH